VEAFCDRLAVAFQFKSVIILLLLLYIYTDCFVRHKSKSLVMDLNWKATQAGRRMFRVQLNISVTCPPLDGDGSCREGRSVPHAFTSTFP